MDEKIAFGQRLLECRKKSGKSQAEIAQLLDITTAAYQNYENGRREAGYVIISKLANFYCVTTDYLLDREPVPKQVVDYAATQEEVNAIIEEITSLPTNAQAFMLELLHRLSNAARTRRAAAGLP